MIKLLLKTELDALFEKYATPLHVRKHSEHVANIARALAQELQKKGVTVDVEATYQSALLHDLLRMCDIRNFAPRDAENWTKEREKIWKECRKKYAGKDHADAGAEVLKEAGYPEIARMIYTHKFIRIVSGKEAPKTWEEKLVYYADKRVLHDRIVTLEERIADGNKRYGSENDRRIAERAQNAIRALEKEIYEKIRKPKGWLPASFTR